MFRLSSLKLVGCSLSLSAALLLGACTEEKPAQTGAADDFSLNMNIPATLTGAVGATSQKSFLAVATDQPCAWEYTDGENPFRNGYSMTHFLVSIMASWTCIADTVIDVAAVIPHDGVIHEGDNDFAADNYDPTEPTHYSITDESDTQVTVRTYYGYDRSAPPTTETTPDFYVSWNKADNGNITGRLIIETGRIAKEKAEDPDRMRMDFSITDQAKDADMYLQFDANPWANGFRIQLHKDLTASPLGQVFTARGMMDMNRQFLPNVTSGDLPDFRMYTVSDKVGEGAARASFSNVVLPIEFATSHFGEYEFVSDSQYFFKANGTSEYINQQIVEATYNGLRTTASTGGSWPNDPSIDLIRALANFSEPYASTYFEAPEVDDQCTKVGDSCVSFLDALFANGLFDQEQNSGTLPEDWRDTAIQSASYLESVYPDGYSSWEGVFTPAFQP